MNLQMVEDMFIELFEAFTCFYYINIIFIYKYDAACLKISLSHTHRAYIGSLERERVFSSKKASGLESTYIR